MLVHQTILPPLKTDSCYFSYSPTRICMYLKWPHFLLPLLIKFFKIWLRVIPLTGLIDSIAVFVLREFS